MVWLELLAVFVTLFISSFLMFALIYRQNDEAVQAAMAKQEKVKGQERKALVKSIKKQHKGSGLLTAKWVEFGGGFYGLVAVLTYLIVEAQEVAELFSSEGGIMEAISNIGISTLINFFIESIMNFITAITWPVFWMGEGQASFWQWIVVAYVGYSAGQWAAKSTNIN